MTHSSSPRPADSAVDGWSLKTADAVTSPVASWTSPRPSKVKGADELQRYLVDEIQEVYRL